MSASMENSKQCAHNKYAVLTALYNAAVVAISVTTWDQVVFNKKVVLIIRVAQSTGSDSLISTLHQ